MSVLFVFLAQQAQRNQEECARGEDKIPDHLKIGLIQLAININNATADVAAPVTMWWLH